MVLPGLPTTWMDHPCSDHMTVPVTSMKKWSTELGSVKESLNESIFRPSCHALPSAALWAPSAPLGSECS